MPGFRARPNAIPHQLIDLGYRPYATTLARLTGLHVDTVRRLLHGQPVSAPTVDVVTRALACSVESLFTSTDDSQPVSSLQAVQ